VEGEAATLCLENEGGDRSEMKEDGNWTISKELSPRSMMSPLRERSQWTLALWSPSMMMMESTTMSLQIERDHRMEMELEAVTLRVIGGDGGAERVEGDMDCGLNPKGRAPK